MSNLDNAWHVIQENGRTSKSESVRLELKEFTFDAPRRLRSIQHRLSHGTFKFPKAKGVPIPKRDEKGVKTGKHRPIVLAPIESRIVQRAILNVAVEVPTLQPFFLNPYSFGGLRGPRTDPRIRSKTERAEHLSAVPAAIKAVLDAIGAGARYVVCADITSFFTKISKNQVMEVVSQGIHDAEFLALFRQAIDVELSNLAELRDKANDFPIEDLGVAQGNSLSPLLGNIILHDFDRVMNDGDCRCIRYIDDFIILAPTEKAANARLRQATKILAALGMALSPEKSSTAAFSINKGVDFLGINVSPGLIRPAKKAQQKLLASIQAAFLTSIKAMRSIKSGQPMDTSKSFIATLKRVDGMIDGWGKHYWFCNDLSTINHLDAAITELFVGFLGAYRDIRTGSDASLHRGLLGLSELSQQTREPFLYPKLSTATP